VFLEILVLAELAVRPAHGYELKKRIHQDLAGQVQLNSNTVYPALRRFTTAGLVTATEERIPGRPSRQVYRLTPAGRDHLHSLLVSFDDTLARRGEEFWTRVAFFDLLSKDERRVVLDARARALAAHRDTLTGLGVRADAEPGPDPEQASGAWSVEVVDLQLRLVAAEQQWLANLTTRLGDPADGATP